jgi:hypothetical protein
MMHANRSWRKVIFFLEGVYLNYNQLTEMRPLMLNVINQHNSGGAVRAAVLVLVRWMKGWFLLTNN